MANSSPIEVQKYLKGVDYPAKKEDLVEAAKKNGADQEICEMIEHLPNQEFEKPTDITKAMGSHSHSR